MSKTIVTILIFILGFVLAGCESNLIDQEAINREVDRKLQKKIIIKISDCRQKALEDAEVYVDSVISELTKDIMVNDMEFPDKPQRDTIEENYNIKIDSVDITKLTDSLNIKTDSLSNHKDTFDSIKN